MIDLNMIILAGIFATFILAFAYFFGEKKMMINQAANKKNDVLPKGFGRLPPPFAYMLRFGTVPQPSPEKKEEIW